MATFDLDLADAAMLIPNCLPICFQGLLGSASDPEAAGDDPPLAIVEPGEQPRDRFPPVFLDVRVLAFVGAGLGGDHEDPVVVGEELSVAAVLPASDGPREMVADRPGGIGAELVAAGEVEPLNRPDHHVVPVTDPLEQVAVRVAAAAWRSRRPGAGWARTIWSLMASTSSRCRSTSSRSEVREARAGSIRSREMPGAPLQVIHLAQEQVGLLLVRDRSEPSARRG